MPPNHAYLQRFKSQKTLKSDKAVYTKINSKDQIKVFYYIYKGKNITLLNREKLFFYKCINALHIF